MTTIAKKHSIEIAEDDPARQTARKTLKVLHNTNVDKENITAALQSGKPVCDLGMKKKPSVSVTSSETQTNANGITEALLTDESANIEYWQARAERAAERAQQMHAENGELRARVDHFRGLYELTKDLLEESRTMVEVLKEILRNSVDADGDDVEEDSEDTVPNATVAIEDENINANDN